MLITEATTEAAPATLARYLIGLCDQCGEWHSEADDPRHPGDLQEEDERDEAGEMSGGGFLGHE